MSQPKLTQQQLAEALLAATNATYASLTEEEWVELRAERALWDATLTDGLAEEDTDD